MFISILEFLTKGIALLFIIAVFALVLALTIKSIKILINQWRKK